jgi:hypothetical protein
LQSRCVSGGHAPADAHDRQWPPRVMLYPNGRVGGKKCEAAEYETRLGEIGSLQECGPRCRGERGAFAGPGGTERADGWCTQGRRAPGSTVRRRLMTNRRSGSRDVCAPWTR